MAGIIITALAFAVGVGAGYIFRGVIARELNSIGRRSGFRRSVSWGLVFPVVITVVCGLELCGDRPPPTPGGPIPSHPR